MFVVNKIILCLTVCIVASSLFLDEPIYSRSGSPHIKDELTTQHSIQSTPSAADITQPETPMNSSFNHAKNPKDRTKTIKSQHIENRNEIIETETKDNEFDRSSTDHSGFTRRHEDEQLKGRLL